LMRSITHLCQMACDLLWQPAGEWVSAGVPLISSFLLAILAGRASFRNLLFPAMEYVKGERARKHAKKRPFLRERAHHRIRLIKAKQS
jgi:hypothetical protein